MKINILLARFFLLGIFSLSSSSLNSQNHGYLNKWIKEKTHNKKQNAQPFEIFKASKIKDDSEIFYLNVDEVVLRQIVSQDIEFLSFKLPIYGIDLDIELFRSKIASDQANVTTSDGQKYLLGKQNHFWGQVRGEESLVAFSFFENEIYGLLSTSRGNFQLAKVKDGRNQNLYALYKRDGKFDLDCATDDNLNEQVIPKSLVSLKSSLNVFDKCINIYLEVHEDIYFHQNLGQSSLTQTINYITALFNLNAMVYANEAITVNISELFVWTNTSPYDGQNMFDYIDQFRDYRTSFNGDFANLFVFESTFGNGIASSINSHCDIDQRRRMAITRIPFWHPSTITHELPDNLWSLNVFAHELGHLFGSPHTHNCSWNGNNTRLDSCFGGTCSNESTVPPINHTIMSYCGDDDPNQSFLTGFGVQPGNLIRYRIQNATCYSDCNESCLANLHIYRTLESEDANGDGFFDSNDNGYIGLSSQAIYNVNFQAQNITADNIIRNYANVAYIAENDIYLDEGFFVDDTSVFNAYITPCNSLLQKRLENLDSVSEKTITSTIIKEKVKIFPNPSGGDLNINSSLNLASLTIMSSSGTILLEKKSIDESSLKLNISYLKSGLFFIKIKLDSGEMIIKKIVVK